MNIQAKAKLLNTCSSNKAYIGVVRTNHTNAICTEISGLGVDNVKVNVYTQKGKINENRYFVVYGCGVWLGYTATGG